MLRIAEDVLQPARFHDLAVIHHHDLLGDVGDDAQIMRDDQNRHPQFRLQVNDLLQYLGLNCHIQSSGRLVGDQQRRMADQGHGDHRPLAQPAGKFERVRSQRPGRVRKADHMQHFAG